MGKHKGKAKVALPRHKLSKSSRFEAAWNGTEDFDGDEMTTRGKCLAYPFPPNIRMHILHAVLYSFLKVLEKEFVEQSRAPLVGDHFPYSRNLTVYLRGDIIGEIRCLSLLGLKRGWFS